MRILTTFFLLVGLTAAQAQKKPLDHSVYDSWRWIKGRKISHDGNWLAYMTGPQKGQETDTLFLETYDGKQKLKIARGTAPQFSYDSQWLLYNIMPTQARIDAAEAQKAPRPQDSTVVLNLRTKQQIKLLAKNVRFPEQSGKFMAYQIESAAGGKELVARNNNTGQEQRFAGVDDFQFEKEGRKLVLKTKHGQDKETRYRLTWLDLQKGTHQEMPLAFTRLEGISFNEAGDQIAFVADTSAVSPEQFAVWLARVNGSPEKLFDSKNPGITAGFQLSANSRPRFNRNGTRLFFHVFAAAPATKGPDKTVANVEVWNTQDEVLFTQQAKLLAQESKKPYTALYFLPEKRVLQVMQPGDEEVQFDEAGTADHALLLSGQAGRRESQWKQYVMGSAWVVSLKDGQRQQVHHQKAIHSFQEHKDLGTQLSPSGKFVVWYDPAARQYFSYQMATGVTRNITAQITEPLFDTEDTTMPHAPSSRKPAFWTAHDQYVYLHADKDLWRVDPTGQQAPVDMTNGLGKRENIRFSYIPEINFSPSLAVGEDFLLGAFDNDTKHEGYYMATVGKKAAPQVLTMGPHAYRAPGFSKARFANRYLLSRGTIATYELYKSDALKTFTRLTNLNPQQKEYVWHTVELVQWKTFDGQPLEGLLYKPENFDPTKKYPVLVYFYENDAKSLFAPTAPAPSASILNFAYYTSNGYVVFNPSIHYTMGQPGESVYNSVMSGIAQLKQNTWFDTTRLGLQGHSWAGYQDLYLLTRTNLFKAAAIGAPVANMVSAYGSIRGTSGNSRHWVYEDSQSRIGKSLWEAPELYIQNSPIFTADKITTPLLLHHNDQDQNVPFAQSFELFTALRRLNKPAWLLNYSGETHVMRNRVNQLDFTLKLQQFFDRYLKDAPTPAWMETSSQPKTKGELLGLEKK
ncbi:MAG: alpha/beta hydrolase family protein [Rufibacter sp.]